MTATNDADDKLMAKFLAAKEAFDQQYPPGSPRRNRMEAIMAEQERKWKRMERIESLADNMGKAVRFLRGSRRR